MKRKKTDCENRFLYEDQLDLVLQLTEEAKPINSAVLQKIEAEELDAVKIVGAL